MAESVRTFWKGHLRLALVSIPVRLVSAEKSDAEIRFHQVDRQTNQRIRYTKTAPGRGEVKKEDIVMGYEVEPGNYVFMEDEELDTLKLPSRHTIELSQFVDANDISPLYFEKPYYVLPDGEVAEEGYRVVRDALSAKRKVGIGQLTLRGRENLVALYPSGRGLVLDTLRYESELKDSSSIFNSISETKLRPDMVQMAEELIERRAEAFDASKFKNHYNDALRELIRSKTSKGQTVPVDESEPEAGAKVLDFMEALKRSVAGKEDAGAKAPRGRTGDKTVDDKATKPATKTPAKRTKAATKAAKADKTASKRRA